MRVENMNTALAQYGPKDFMIAGKCPHCKGLGYRAEKKGEAPIHCNVCLGTGKYPSPITSKTSGFIQH